MTRTTVDPQALRQSLVAGVVIAVLLLVGGSAYALSQSQQFTAESVVVVLPSATLDDATSAAYYETLSRGQIVATFAEVAGNLRFEQQAEDRLSLTADEREAVSTAVTVVPDTAVILIRSTAPTAEMAEQMAAQVTELSSDYWAGLSKPYRTQAVGTPKGSAYSSGSSPLILLAAAVGVAAVAGVATQQAVYHLGLAARAGRGSTAAGPSAEDGDAEGSDDWQSRSSGARRAVRTKGGSADG